MDANVDTKFDVAILGTGLAESIVAAALSKAGLKVLHVDENNYYGSDEASLTIQELAEHCEKNPETWMQQGTPPGGSRAYSLSLEPTILPATGPLITSLIESGVSRYTSFKLLDKTAMWDSGASNEPGSSCFKTVPTSKASIFSSALPLPQKRKLMRLIQLLIGCTSAEDLAARPEVVGKERTGIIQFLTLPNTEGGSFGLTREIAEGVAYALGFCESEEEESLPTLQRIYSYLRSAGRYGDSPFLIGYYGGLGEIAQGFCRMAAVHGGTYILGHKIEELSAPNPERTDWNIRLKDIPDMLSARLVISSQRYSTTRGREGSVLSADATKHIASCIAILPLNEGPEETSLRIFQPSVFPQTGYSHSKTVYSLITGADTLSCPSSYAVAYLRTASQVGVNPAEVLGPYLEKFTSPIYAAYSSSHIDPPDANGHDTNLLVVGKSPESLLTEIADWLALEAKRLFWDAIKALQVDLSVSRDEGEMWPPRTDQEESYDE